MRFNIFLKWELDSLGCLLDEVPPFLKRRAEEAKDTSEHPFTIDGSLSDAERYISAYTLVLEAVAQHLNTVVDWSLLVMASGILPTESRLTPKALSRSRNELIKAIEEAYKIQVKALPGWSQVERVRYDANALKHCGGISLLAPTSDGIPQLEGVYLEPNELRRQIAEVGEWLTSLWFATGGGEKEKE
jgi:hypothetical protein